MMRAHSGSVRLGTGLVLSALTLTACGAGGGGNGGDATDAADSLTIVVEGGGKAELEPIAAKFTEETGTGITFVELPYDGLFDRLSSEFATGTVSFDVAALDAIWLPTFADAVITLDDLFTDEVQADLFPGLLEEARVDGTFRGMPAWTNSEILFYRKDLFEDPAEQAAFEQEYGYPLAVPTTWDEFTDAAVFFTRDTNGDGSVDLYGTDVKGAVETEWLAHVLQAGSPGAVLDSDGNVIIDNAEHLAALEFYSSFATELDVSPPGAAQLDWAAAQNLFNQGQLAMLRFWAHAFPQIPEDSPVHGEVGAAPMIGGAAGTAGIPGAWYLSVPAASEQQDLARQFVQFAYDNNELSVDTALGLAARTSVFEDYAEQPGFEHYGAMLTTLAAPATAPRPATAEWQQIVDTVLIPTIQQSLTPGADNQQLLDAAKTQIEQLLD
jgi:ABC-type glycerol-3-phosphate transport system substrate-binding protein